MVRLGQLATPLSVVAILTAAAASSFAPADANPRPEHEPVVAPAQVPPVQPLPAPVPNPLSGLDLGAARIERGRYVQRLADGRSIELTIEPELQSRMTRVFRENQVPMGVAVAVDSRTGRILALAEQGGRGLWADASAPAASVFKVVTVAALLEHEGFDPGQEVCYGGGSHRLIERDLQDDVARDRQCANVAQAIGFSLNAVIAKLADRNLDRTSLAAVAQSFGWNAEIPFDLPVQVSAADFPEQRLELARTAAGFWHTRLSPLHGALIAQAIAQNGQMLRPWIVSRVQDAHGQTLFEGQPRFLRHVVQPATARSLGRMMTVTTANGTSRRAFHDPQGRPYLPGIRVAGKTGTLNSYEPFRAYTWFVGFAPVDSPRIAVATLVVNDPTWRIKASEVARELLQAYFRPGR